MVTLYPAKQSIFGNLIQNQFSKRFAEFRLFGVYLFYIAFVGSDLEPPESDIVVLIHFPKGGTKSRATLILFDSVVTYSITTRLY